MSEIEKNEKQFMDDFEEVGDWLLQFQMLLEMIPDVEAIPKEERTEENRIRSCQSSVWVDCSIRDGKVFVREYSEALIIRGILAVYATLVNGHSPEEVAAYEPSFVSKTALYSQLNTDRRNGFSAIVEKVQSFARNTSISPG